MGKSTPSQPAAPNPTTTANAQTASNQQTALYNFGLNNPNVSTPLGSVSYSVDTSNPNQPTSTQNISLSPIEQQLYNQNTQQQLAESNIATGLEGTLSDSLNTPQATSGDFNTEAQNAANAYYNSQMAYLQPQQATSQEQLNNQLANQGIMPGSAAYQTAQDQQNRNNTFQNQQATDSSILNGTQNAQQLFSLTSAAQELPLNEYSALMSGSQASMPQFSAVNPSSAMPTNVAGITQNAYQDSLNGYNSQVAQNNSLNSGLFGLGGSALGAFGNYAGSAGGAATLASLFSDIRLKENITHTGHENGFPIYEFAYRSDPAKARYRGVMAQDVIQTRPDAITWDGNYMKVDYGMIGIPFERVQ